MNQQTINHICLLILASVAVVISLIYTQKILVPFIISLFIYISFSPLIFFLQDKTKLPKLVSLFLVATFCLSIFVGIGFLTVYSVNNFILEIDQYQERVLDFVKEINSFLISKGVNFDLNEIQSLIKDFPIAKIVSSSYGNIIDILGNMVLISIITLFLFMGAGKTETESKMMRTITQNVSKYINIKIMTSFFTSLLVAGVLFFYNIELALLLVILTFVLNFIPSIGSIISTSLPIPLLILKFGFSFNFFFVLLLLGTIQFLIGNVIEPKIMGNTLNLHPIAVLLFLIFWGTVWGIPGMFLAVPITAILKIVLNKIPSTKKVALILEGKID